MTDDERKIRRARLEQITRMLDRFEYYAQLNGYDPEMRERLLNRLLEIYITDKKELENDHRTN